MTITGFIYNESTHRMIPSWDPIDPILQESMATNRLNICKECEKIIYDSSTNKYTCGLCRCGLEYKLRMIFPLDENGHAISNIHDNKKYYVCRLEKW